MLITRAFPNMSIQANIYNDPRRYTVSGCPLLRIADTNTYRTYMMNISVSVPFLGEGRLGEGLGFAVFSIPPNILPLWGPSSLPRTLKATEAVCKPGAGTTLEHWGKREGRVLLKIPRGDIDGVGEVK